MEALERRVAGDWYEIREAARSFDSLDAYFRISEEQLRIQIEKLESAVEQGIVEYKRASAGPLFNILEGARYASPGFDELKRQVAYTGALLYVMLVQRQLTEGVLKLATERQTGGEISPDDLDFKEILKDVNVRIKENRDAARHPAIKTVLLQAAQLRAERENLQKLLPTIKPESRETFLANYRKTFAGFIDKIKRTYAVFLADQMPDQDKAGPILQAVPLQKAAPVLTAQCEIISRMRSTLIFAIDEKYKIREFLVNLTRRKEPFTQALEREARLYSQLAASVPAEQVEGDRSLGRGFCREIIRLLERQLSHAEAGIR